MSRSTYHRPSGATLLETVALVPLTKRKAIMFSIVEENGQRLGELLHVGLSPSGKAVIPVHAQRLVMAEPVAARFVEAAAGVGVKLREARR